MTGTLDEKQVFVGAASVIELMHHISGDEIVLCAVDKEHRHLRMADALDRVDLFEIVFCDMFVEEIDGTIVAAARINKEQVPEYADASWTADAPDDEVMVLHALVVSPKTKGKGYGTAFVDFYEKHALENGCPYLRMDTNARNTAARSLYKKLGYTEVSIVPCVFNGIDGVQLVCLEKNL